MTVKPMLACSESPDLQAISYPKAISPKLDGFRCLIVNGQAMSRKMIPIPNLYVQEALSSLPHGLDGELIVGPPTGEQVFTTTAKGVGKTSGKPDFTFWVFDDFSVQGNFVERYKAAREAVKKAPCFYARMVEHTTVFSAEQARMYSDARLAEGYEGAMLRSLGGPYKHGRSTMKEEWLLKIKFWQDAEGLILDYYEQETNLNEAQKDAFGRTKRSTAKAGKVGNGTLGGANVRWHNGKEEIEFGLAAGGTNEEVAALWAIRDTLPGQLVTFKYNGVGVNGRPRFPVWKGLRSKIDV